MRPFTKTKTVIDWDQFVEEQESIVEIPRWFWPVAIIAVIVGLVLGWITAPFGLVPS